MTRMNISMKLNRFTDVENRLVVTKVGVGLGEGWIGSLGLTNANYYR